MSIAGAARPKPYQVLEDPPGGGSHVLLQGDSQPVSAVPACGRVLADVGPSRVDAKAFDVARRPVRHVAPPPHQDRRPRRRDEDHDPGALADLMPRSGYPALRSGTHTAPRHMTDGAQSPNIHRRPFNRKPSSPGKLRLQAGAAADPRPNVGEIQKKVTRTQRSRARTRQSAALSGLDVVDIMAQPDGAPAVESVFFRPKLAPVALAIARRRQVALIWMRVRRVCGADTRASLPTSPLSSLR